MGFVFFYNVLQLGKSWGKLGKLMKNNEFVGFVCLFYVLKLGKARKNIRKTIISYVFYFDLTNYFTVKKNVPRNLVPQLRF